MPKVTKVKQNNRNETKSDIFPCDVFEFFIFH